MALSAVKSGAVQPTANGHTRVADAVRRVTHFPHEARLLKEMAADALEDGVHAVKRAVKSAERRVEALADFKDEAIHRVKRHPLQGLGAALGVGLGLGLLVGWAAGRCGRRE